MVLAVEMRFGVWSAYPSMLALVRRNLLLELRLCLSRGGCSSGTGGRHGWSKQINESKLREHGSA